MPILDNLVLAAHILGVLPLTVNDRNDAAKKRRRSFVFACIGFLSASLQAM